MSLMRAVLQRVKWSNVKVENKMTGNIDLGLMILLGVSEEDDNDDLNWLSNKVMNMRIFADQEGKMNVSLKDIKGSALVISQFTLFASTKKGNRPSFIRAAGPKKAIEFYEKFIAIFRENEIITEAGSFGKHMEVELLNDGPVTIFIDSKNKE